MGSGEKLDLVSAFAQQPIEVEAVDVGPARHPRMIVDEQNLQGVNCIDRFSRVARIVLRDRPPGR